ncbi:MAG: GspH/FimT family pseudopilin [Sulfuritalea sp.]|nr:GspH/FimT family pseudopilin [Sulfuritalea sp.]
MVSQRRRAHGFTLIEVMVVIAIAGILMSIAVPGVKSLLNTQKMKSATFDLVTTAMLARSDAIKWSGASSASISIVAPSNNFSSGWCIVFTSTSTCSTSSPGDGVMQIVKPTSGVSYTYQGTAAPIVFTRTGRLAGGIAVTLLVADDDNFATPRCVTFDTNGNARVRVMAAGTTSCT